MAMLYQNSSLSNGPRARPTMCLQVVIYSGIGLSIIPAITLLFFDDGKFIKEDDGPESAAPKVDSVAGAVACRGRATSDRKPRP